MNIEPLLVKPGEKVTAAKWNALLRFIRRLLDQFRQMAGRGLHVDEHADGIALWAEAADVSFTGAFAVSLRARAVTVGLGLVNGNLIPTIDGRPCDGSDDAKKGPPQLSLRNATAGAELRTWIVLQATLPEGATEITGTEDDELIIVHTDDLAAVPAGSGWEPLAMLEWADAKTPRAVRQIAYFHKRHIAKIDAKTGAVTHFFPAAA